MSAPRLRPTLGLTLIKNAFEMINIETNRVANVTEMTLGASEVLASPKITMKPKPAWPWNV